MAGKTRETDDLAKEVRALHAEVTLRNSHRFVRIHTIPPQRLAFNFARGFAVGPGTLLGATVLLSLPARALSQIEFLPISRDRTRQIADEMQEMRGDSRWRAHADHSVAARPRAQSSISSSVPSKSRVV